MNITELPASHPIVDLAISFGLPQDNRHGFQAALERFLYEPKRPKSSVPIKGKKIAWKRYSPMRGGNCGQCGDSASHFNCCAGHPALCDRCFLVLENSRKHWVPNDDFPSAG